MMKILHVSSIAVMTLAASGALAANPMPTNLDMCTPAGLIRASVDSAKLSSLVEYPRATLGDLPHKGNVHITGRITSTEADSFVLTDPTGSIRVMHPSDRNLGLTQNAEVVVLGEVEGSGNDRHVMADRIRKTNGWMNTHTPNRQMSQNGESLVDRADVPESGNINQTTGTWR